MQQNSKLTPLENFADKSVPALYCCVPTAHMSADSEDFLRLKMHEVLNKDDRLVCVLSARELLIDFIDLFLVPLAGLLILDIAKAFLVEVDLANVVKQRNNCDSFFGVAVLQSGVYQASL